MKRKEGLLLLGIVGTLTIGGMGVQHTLSYFTQKETVTNVFTVGDLEIDLREPEWNPEDGDGKNVSPGYTVYKNPTVKNVAAEDGKTQPCYLQMVIKVLDADGKTITDEKRLELIRETIRYDSSYTGNWSKTGAASGLVQGKIPGYSESDIVKYPMVNPDFEEKSSTAGEWVFVYKGGKNQILKENEEVTLFTDIVYPTEWSSEEMELLGEYQLEISAQAVQAEGFASRDEALKTLSANK